MTDDLARILAPVGDPDAEHFWTALDEGTLSVSACRSCGRRWLPPMATCPRCGSAEVGSEAGPATGRLYTWTVIHMAADPLYATETPYVVGLVDLAIDDPGACPVRLYGRVLGVAHDDLCDGLELQVGITRVDDKAIWYFGPARSS